MTTKTQCLNYYLKITYKILKNQFFGSLDLQICITPLKMNWKLVFDQYSLTWSKLNHKIHQNSKFDFSWTGQTTQLEVADELFTGLTILVFSSKEFLKKETLVEK